MDLREVRKSRKMSRLFVEAETGIKPNTLSKKESGLRPWSVPEFQMLCDLYGVSDPTALDDFKRFKKK